MLPIPRMTLFVVEEDLKRFPGEEREEELILRKGVVG
jgi:hypothetical protein